MKNCIREKLEWTANFESTRPGVPPPPAPPLPPAPSPRQAPAVAASGFRQPSAAAAPRNPRRRRHLATSDPLLRISQNFRKKINKFQKAGVYPKQKEMVYTSSKNLENPWCIPQTSKKRKWRRGVYLQTAKHLHGCGIHHGENLEKRRVSKNSAILELAFSPEWRRSAEVAIDHF